MFGFHKGIYSFNTTRSTDTTNNTTRSTTTTFATTKNTTTTFSTSKNTTTSFNTSRSTTTSFTTSYTVSQDQAIQSGLYGWVDVYGREYDRIYWGGFVSNAPNNGTVHSVGGYTYYRLNPQGTGTFNGQFEYAWPIRRTYPGSKTTSRSTTTTFGTSRSTTTTFNTSKSTTTTFNTTNSTTTTFATTKSTTTTFSTNFYS